MAYFEFLPVDADDNCLVNLVDVKAGTRLCRYRVGDVLRGTGFKNRTPQFSFVRRKDVVLSIESDKTNELELQTALERGFGGLRPYGVTMAEHTSFADVTTIPGHYVLYWELRGGAEEVPASVFDDCCLVVEESLNGVYRQCRTAEGRLTARDQAGGGGNLRPAYGFCYKPRGIHGPVQGAQVPAAWADGGAHGRERKSEVLQSKVPHLDFVNDPLVTVLGDPMQVTVV
ncbi:hypothetical protein HPP92_017869 [Vanilla planifolia]|uniref:Uncharacterized protein n=1 Tax=Vanilla planifolia TaxID=51239 RepID=A0A835QD04_VANPL|nr:hypothetical protein HPP92_018444 [Vanilla planifolia]KAG0468541.1 hypothetical protein HPP92_017869 [Vanilla planifolia]